ncbi:hypothetical protein ACMZOO_00890 [Catenovulum sp. SX2]|uniref:hypothetical protein n=1 Tax=Catenovulum sp. SX2 TaxID=3398614 RepID=UPI003F82D4C7
MRLTLLIWILFSFHCYCSSKESLVVGNWVCDSFTVGDEAAGIFDVSHTVEYRSNGTSTDIHFYKLRGYEEQIWLKVAYSGPWKIEGNLLVEETEETEIVDAAHPELKNSEEVKAVMTFEDTKFVSEIIELTNSKFVTKKLDEDEIGTCLKV